MLAILCMYMCVSAAAAAVKEISPAKHGKKKFLFFFFFIRICARVRMRTLLCCVNARVCKESEGLVARVRVSNEDDARWFGIEIFVSEILVLEIYMQTAAADRYCTDYFQWCATQTYKHTLKYVRLNGARDRGLAAKKKRDRKHKRIITVFRVFYVFLYSAQISILTAVTRRVLAIGRLRHFWSVLLMRSFGWLVAWCSGCVACRRVLNIRNWVQRCGLYVWRLVFVSGRKQLKRERAQYWCCCCFLYRQCAMQLCRLSALSVCIYVYFHHARIPTLHTESRNVRAR